VTTAGTPLTVGTAGHIDHGKTALVRRLTGRDTDRLPEERARGMSIDLGFAPLEAAGRRLSLVDVPGHERFVRTMVAGATGVDLFLLVVAADDGVMPQTREHAAVLRALGVTAGVVAVTKADLADPERARGEIRELVAETVPVVACSARTGAGVEEVRAALAHVAAGVPGVHARAGGAVLHVDRAFTVHGAGTVVTGTLWSGSLGAGDRVTLLPAGRGARVRSVQVHDSPVERAQAGQRVAVNLAGVRLGAVGRGDVVAGADADLEASWILDVALDLGGAPVPRRAQIHHGTRETPARIASRGEGRWQLRCDRPLVASAGDRLVVRAISPPGTLGGGTVLDPRARRARPRPAPAPAAAPRPAPPPAEPRPLSPAEVERRLREAADRPPRDNELGDGAQAALAELRGAGRAVRLDKTTHVHRAALDEVSARVAAIVTAEGSITLARLRDELGTSRRYAQALLETLDAERVTLRLPDDSRVLRRRGGRA
jgi:selenocysteine-specific elongation factor